MEVLYATSRWGGRKRSTKIELIRALNVLGFTTWNELQSGNACQNFEFNNPETSNHPLAILSLLALLYK